MANRNTAPHACSGQSAVPLEHAAYTRNRAASLHHVSVWLAQHDLPPAVLCGVWALRDYLGKAQAKGMLLLQLLLAHAADITLHAAAVN